jgi:sugar phosphate permease
MGHHGSTTLAAERTGPSRVRYLVLTASCVLALLAYVQRVGFATGGAELKQEFHFSDQQWGYVMAAFLLAYGAFEIPWGIVGDRLGARHVLTLATFISSALTAATALLLLLPSPAEATNGPGQGILLFAVLITLRFGFGTFQAAAFPAISRITADWIPVSERGTAQGLVWTCSRVGGALAPFLILWLIRLCGGWGAAFALVGALGFGWCAVFWPWFRDRPEEMAQVNAAERARIAEGRLGTPAGHAWAPWGRFLRSRSAWALCLTYGCGGFAANFFVTYLPSYLRNQRQLSAETAQLLTSLPLACGIAGCLLGGLLSDAIIRRTGNRKWGRRLNGTIGTAIAGLAYFCLNRAGATWELATLLCIIFFCNDIAMAPAWAATADIGRRYAGTLGGAMNMLGNLAGAAGNVLAGHLFQREQVGLVFVIYAISYWLGTLCWQGVDVTRPLEEEADHKPVP